MTLYEKIMNQDRDMFLFCTAVSPEVAGDMITEISGLLNITPDTADIEKINAFSREDFSEKDICFLFSSGTDTRSFILLEINEYQDFWEIFIHCPAGRKEIIHKSFLKYQILTDGGLHIIRLQNVPHDCTYDENTRFHLKKCIRILSGRS